MFRFEANLIFRKKIRLYRLNLVLVSKDNYNINPKVHLLVTKGRIISLLANYISIGFIIIEIFESDFVCITIDNKPNRWVHTFMHSQRTLRRLSNVNPEYGLLSARQCDFFRDVFKGKLLFLTCSLSCFISVRGV